MTYEDNGTRHSGFIYRRYEKMAKMTLKEIRLNGGMTLFVTSVITAGIIGLLEYNGLIGWIASIVAGALFGAVFGGVFVGVMAYGSRRSKMYKLEITEGYSDRMIEEMRKLEKVTPVTAATVALIYNFRGEYMKAINELQKVNAFSLHSNPNGAHDYFSALVQACILSGDAEYAKAAYENGLYYMKTYMNSPVSGAHISLSLAMYEYFLGRYDVSLDLLDNAFRILNAGFEPEQHIPDENMRSILSYWRAKNLIAVGNNAEAFKMLTNCDNYYKTDYYREKIDGLKKELNENETVS